MRRDALSIRAWGLSRNVLQSAVLAVLMLATRLGAAWPCQSPAVEPQGRVEVFTATGKDQSDFTDCRLLLIC